MAVGERFQSGGARGIARFLSDHQHCDGGFDVHREAGDGAGRLMITCKGCGQSIGYNAAEAGELGAGLPIADDDPPPEPPSADAERPSEPSAPLRERLGAVAPARPRPRRSGDSGLRRWLAPALIGALIVAGVVMIVLGISRSAGDSDSSPASAATETEAAAPTETTPTETAPTQTPAPPAQTTPLPADEPAGDVVLNRRSFAGRFAIGVPAGWRSGSRDNAISIAPAGDVAEIRVFLEPGADSTSDLARAAAGFLADEHPGAQVGAPKPMRLGDSRARSVTAVYGGGEETAVVLTSGGFTYVVLRRVDGGASEVVAAEADAALKSFRAKG